ncbi:MAG: glycosyltransferase family 2 protein [Candidatus Eisenbacteria sp.]|nr:glycosyltransferase family 2 protein [Candidatus Eisenbacteria bacterium]
MSPVTVLVPTFNEEGNLRDCLESVKWADEILLVDCGSTDRTLEIAREYGARILRHPYENSAAQKNWAIPQATHDWVLVVDADERVTPELQVEISRIARNTTVSRPGYWIRRRNFFLGREIRYCGWQRDRVLRLFEKDEGRYESRRVHAEIQLCRAGVLHGSLLHYSYRTLGDYLTKADRYASWGVGDLLEAGKRTGPVGILGHAAFRFVKMYLLQRGFLDGAHGLVLSVLGSFTVFLKYAKLWEMRRARHG